MLTQPNKNCVIKLYLLSCKPILTELCKNSDKESTSEPIFQYNTLPGNCHFKDSAAIILVNLKPSGLDKVKWSLIIFRSFIIYLNLSAGHTSVYGWLRLTSTERLPGYLNTNPRQISMPIPSGFTGRHIVSILRRKLFLSESRLYNELSLSESPPTSIRWISDNIILFKVWCEIRPRGGGDSHTWTWYGTSALLTPIFDIFRSHWVPFYANLDLSDPFILQKRSGCLYHI